MSKEIDDLLEINSDESTSQQEIKPENATKHIFIHLAILFGLIGLCYFLLETENGSNDQLLIAFVFAIVFLVFFVVLIVESIYYQIKKKFKLRNVTLFTILIFIITTALFLFTLGL